MPDLTLAESHVISCATELRTTLELARELRGVDIEIGPRIWQLLDMQTDELCNALAALERERKGMGE